jgi:hypothetical protein
VRYEKAVRRELLRMLERQMSLVRLMMLGRQVMLG